MPGVKRPPTRSDVRRWAREYLSRGFGLARIKPGQKRPTDKGWTLRSCDPDAFREGDSIGLLGGRLSGDAVCLDLDCPEALGFADRLLPPTNMIEGRPSKPRSHRWYRVTNIPAELTAPTNVAGGLGGPRTRQFRRPDGKVVLEFRGTGSQAVVPPSVWAKGDRVEVREWASLGSPAVIDCRELFEATCRLATACGWLSRGPARQCKEPPTVGEAEVEVPPLPAGHAARQARAYVAKMPGAVGGAGGDRQTFTVACVLVLDFGLTPEEALPLLLEYNGRCVPPWTLEQLRHKLAEADAQEREERGWRVRRPTYAVRVHLLPDDPGVVVGLDVVAEGRSFVDLSPSLFAGLLKHGKGWRLAPELAALPWQGRQVLLAPASTISTNSREVWSEFWLARLLRQEGAEVQSLRLPPLEGRRRTLGMAAEVDWEVKDPPRHAWQAAQAAEQARQEARRLDAYRRSLPRRKASPKLQKAVAFLREHNVMQLTKEVVQKALEKGITRTTLKRGLKTLSAINTPPTPSSCEMYPPIWTCPNGPGPCGSVGVGASAGPQAA